MSSSHQPTNIPRNYLNYGTKQHLGQTVPAKAFSIVYPQLTNTNRHDTLSLWIKSYSDFQAASMLLFQSPTSGEPLVSRLRKAKRKDHTFEVLNLLHMFAVQGNQAKHFFESKDVARKVHKIQINEKTYYEVYRSQTKPFEGPLFDNEPRLILNTRFMSTVLQKNYGDRFGSYHYRVLIPADAPIVAFNVPPSSSDPNGFTEILLPPGLVFVPLSPDSVGYTLQYVTTLFTYCKESFHQSICTKKTDELVEKYIELSRRSTDQNKAVFKKKLDHYRKTESDENSNFD